MTTIIHVGYELIIGDDQRSELQAHLTDIADIPVDRILTNPTTAVMFRSSQPDMSHWFTRRKDKPYVAYLRGLFVNSRHADVVGRFTIDSIHTYVILTKGTTRVRPIELKKQITLGMLGAEITLSEPIAIPCRAYQYCQATR